MNANEFMHLPVGVGAGYHSQDLEQHRRQIDRLPSAPRWSRIDRKISNSDAGMRQPPIRVVAYDSDFSARGSQIARHRSEN